MQQRRVGVWTVVAVEGEIDLYSAPQLRDAVLAAVEGGADHVVIDLSAVPFMDSSGLGVVVACLKRLREAGGELAVVTPAGSPPTKLLSLTGLDQAIPTHATVEEATV
jgi:anti-sigma B factor antagonist